MGGPGGSGGQKPLSPVRMKNESKKHVMRSRKTPNDPRHNNRKHGLRLNPFRQEDENEVLAKRTHNRRRWSHVFPLGEGRLALLWMHRSGLRSHSKYRLS